MSLTAVDVKVHARTRQRRAARLDREQKAKQARELRLRQRDLKKIDKMVTRTARRLVRRAVGNFRHGYEPSAVLPVRYEFRTGRISFEPYNHEDNEATVRFKRQLAVVKAAYGGKWHFRVRVYERSPLKYVLAEMMVVSTNHH